MIESKWKNKNAYDSPLDAENIIIDAPIINVTSNHQML